MLTFVNKIAFDTVFVESQEKKHSFVFILLNEKSIKEKQKEKEKEKQEKSDNS